MKKNECLNPTLIKKYAMKNPFNAGAETGKQPYLVFAKAKELQEAGPPEANNIEMFAKAPFIYYLSTFRERREGVNFCLLSVQKTQLW